jgi:hypothetical protein
MQIDDEMASSPSYYLRVVSMPLTANRMLGLTTGSTSNLPGIIASFS